MLLVCCEKNAWYDCEIMPDIEIERVIALGDRMTLASSRSFLNSPVEHLLTSPKHMIYAYALAGTSHVPRTHVQDNVHYSFKAPYISFGRVFGNIHIRFIVYNYNTHTRKYWLSMDQYRAYMSIPYTNSEYCICMVRQLSVNSSNYYCPSDVTEQHSHL